MTRSKEALLVKAFTKDPTQGNSAGVVLYAQGMTTEQMITIAAQLGFSESAFVFPSANADFRVRFFTPTSEMALCGHATIATFYSLIQSGRIAFGDTKTVTVKQETGAGILSVICHTDGLIEMEQAKPFFYDAHFEKDTLADLLRISVADIGDTPIQLVSTGTPKLLIPILSFAALERIKPDLVGMKKLSEQSEVRGFYPFTTDTHEGDFYARQFNPFAGVAEDPTTGVAAGALGAYAAAHKLTTKKQLVIAQGKFVGKSGEMYVSVDGDTILVGGYATLFEKQRIIT